MALLRDIVHVLGSHGHMTRGLKLLNSLISTNKPLKQQRNLVTKFIASKHSRQEFEPVLGPVVDKPKCEPLHLGNNCWQVWNKEVMNIALTRTNPDASIATVYQLPFECCFRRYLRAVRNKVKSHKLYKRKGSKSHLNVDLPVKQRESFAAILLKL